MLGFLVSNIAILGTICKDSLTFGTDAQPTRGLVAELGAAPLRNSDSTFEILAALIWLYNRYFNHYYSAAIQPNRSVLWKKKIV
ncbi:hypothetical protein ES703_41216 [subsurface metagenome]